LIDDAGPTLRVRVDGHPQGQGRISGGGLRQSKAGKLFHQPSYHSNRAKLDPWRAAIVEATGKAMVDQHVPDPLDGPLYLQAEFHMPRGKTVKRLWPTTTPDLDHLLRALGDALTKAGAVTDDARIVTVQITKRYADGPLDPGVTFTLREVVAAPADGLAA
jgi:Holliday junction resolvase RusA-like endonuclease